MKLFAFLCQKYMLCSDVSTGFLIPVYRYQSTNFGAQKAKRKKKYKLNKTN